MPESGLPIRVYKEHEMWHVDYGEGVIETLQRGGGHVGGRRRRGGRERTVVVEE